MGDGADTHGREAGGSPITVFLSLFMLVLAFFIVLTAISQREQKRAAEAIGSVAEVFRSGDRIVVSPARRPGEAAFDPAGSFHEEMRRLLQATLPIAPLDPVQDGEVLRVTVPAHLLFRHGSAELLPRGRRLVEGVAEGLKRREQGLRYEAELVLGVGESLPRGANPGANLAVRRAGSFARALGEHGAPPRAIQIGLRPGDPNEAQLTFYRRDDVRWKPAGDGRR